MTTASIGAFPATANGALRADASRRAALPFAVFAAALIIVAYTAPFEYAWNQSTYEDDSDDDRPEVAAQSGSLQRQVALGALGLVGLATLACSRDSRTRLKGTLGYCCAAYLAWCAASILWTDDFAISSRRVIGLGCEVLAGIAIAERASPRQFVWLVLACTLTWLGMGICAELVHGTLRPWQPGYRFDGVFYPNIMAGNCVLLFLSSIYLSASGDRTKRPLQAIALLALVFLVLTGSRTALGTLLALVGIFAFIKLSPRTKIFVAWALGLATAVILFMAGLGANFSTDWASLGRADHDMWSLTGRIPLWQELFDQYARFRPFLGHGYGAFWTPVHITEVAQSQGWSPAYAHSTYVDLLMSIGLIGIFLFLFAMILALTKAIRLEARYANCGFGFIALLIAGILLDGTLESTFGNTSFTSFFCICGICCVIVASGPTRHWRYGKALA